MSPAPPSHRPEDLRRTFDAAAAIYHQARPAYPPALFDRLAELLPPCPRVLEIGPGTGQATEPMLERGASVRAVELGPNLAATLVHRLAPAIAAGRLRVEVDDVELLAVDPSSVDAVVSATAFHWIRPSLRLTLPRRWLRPDGRLAVIDTMQVASAVDGGYYEAAQAIYARFGQANDSSAPRPDDVEPPILAIMEAAAECTAITLDRFRCDQTYTPETYRQLLRTFSGPLSMPQLERDAMIEALVTLVCERGGSLTRPLVMTLATCRFHSRKDR